MKKIFILFLTIIITLAFLTACQNTPEKPVVIQKDLEQMIEKAQTTPEISQPAELPEHFTDEITDDAKNVTVKIDAAVLLPKANAIPVLRVEKGEITQEITDILIDKLVHGQLYKSDADGQFDKTSIQDQILLLQSKLADGQVSDRQTVQNLIGELQQKYELAPADPVPISGQFENGFGYNTLTGKLQENEKVQCVSGTTHSDAGYETFYIWKHENSPQNSCVKYVREPNAAVGYSTGIGSYITREEAYDPASTVMNKGELSNFTVDQINSIPDINLTREQAEEQVAAVISALGQDYLGLYSAEKVYGGSYDGLLNAYGISNPLRCVWRLRYTRFVSGVGITYTSEQCGASEDDMQAAPWSYEDMVFYIDDTGIVGFDWSAPYKTADIAVENANVKSFDDVMNVLEKMLTVKYARQDGGRVEFEITGIRFGLTRITEQNKRDSGLLIPVWDFFGKYTQYIDQGNGKTMECVMDEPYRSLLTINAIDGSIIDRSLGY